MAKKPSLLDEIRIGLAAARPTTWWDHIPAEAQEELSDARQKFQSGQIGGRRMTVARILVNSCRERGWKTCDYKRMAEWLARND